MNCPFQKNAFQLCRSFQIDEQSTQFGNGLRALGLKPRDNTCIFAETKAEWLVCALGCFKQTFPLVTLYANLGEEAVAHGVNQTEVTHVITTHELLPKFKKVREHYFGKSCKEHSTKGLLS